MAAGSGRYWFAPRPSDVVHGYPILVFDTRDQISIALTLFAREGLRAKAAGTASAYLYAILPFHTYLETDPWQQGAGRSWDGPANQVRLAVADYLMQRLGCRVSEHRNGCSALTEIRRVRN